MNSKDEAVARLKAVLVADRRAVKEGANAETRMPQPPVVAPRAPQEGR